MFSLIFIIIFILIIILLITYMLYEANLVEIRDVSILSKKIKNSIKIVLISDIHSYKKMSKKRIENIKNKINDINKNNDIDLALIAGDIIDSRDGIDNAIDILKNLKSKYGVYAVLGNHDYYEYNFFHIFVPFLHFIDRVDNNYVNLVNELNEIGIRVLFNENIILDINDNPINLYGIDSKDLKKEKYKIDTSRLFEDKFNIILSHYPDIIVFNKNIYDLVLSGHTHGGQITFFGYPITVKSHVNRKTATGINSFEKTITLTTKGSGVSRYIPFRFFANQEIVLIEIKSFD